MKTRSQLPLAGTSFEKYTKMTHRAQFLVERERGQAGVELELLHPAVWLASFGVFVCSLDSALNVAFPAISEAFGVPPEPVALLIVFYQVPIGILTVLGGLLGDRFGHRHVFAAGVWTSALAFPLCGLAPDFTAFLAARAVQGVGAGLVFGTAPALV